MHRIPLTRGMFALVDDEDFDALSKYKWCVSHFGYAVRNEGSKQVRMHRQIMGVDDRWILVDHVNMNRTDNRRKNLRTCTQAENLRNRPSANNKSGYKGVTHCAKTDSWCAKIGYKGRCKNLGYYETAQEAHEVYCLWADMLHGEFAHYGVKS